MSGYVIAHVVVTDAVQYEEYKKLSSAAMAKYGAEICVRGGQIEVVEGDWAPERLVIFKFPTFAQAKAYAASPEYSLARASRQHAAVMSMLVVEGL